jgi:hypothetical protein
MARSFCSFVYTAYLYLINTVLHRGIEFSISCLREVDALLFIQKYNVIIRVHSVSVIFEYD